MAKKTMLVCNDCVFMRMELYNMTGGKWKEFEVKNDIREQARNRNFNNVPPNMHLCCIRGRWRERDPSEHVDRLVRILETDRSKCPSGFMLYQPGVSVDAAIEQQGLEREKAEKSSDTRLRIAGWVIPSLVAYALGLLTGQSGLINWLWEQIKNLFHL